MTTQIAIEDNLDHERAKLLGSLLLFTKLFYKLRTGREFEISQPIGRESHHLTIFRELKLTFELKQLNLGINVAPGSGKSEMLIHFVAWAMAHYPDSNFLYISYSVEIATKHTHTIRQIMEMPHYKELFGVSIKSESAAKDNFMTHQGGSVKAFGSMGSITGQDAGLPNLDRFSGALIMDDMHKPSEVHSDTMRNGVITNYKQTIKPRRRGINVPFIFIGQVLHQHGLSAYLFSGEDGNEWKQVVLPSLDENLNALYPKVHPKEFLLREKEHNPYVFASQYQQKALPAGGGIFKEEWFTFLDLEPEVLVTFITVDSAETSKTYNDATVFSFWGIYKIYNYGIETELYGLVWLDCIEIWVEPKDLQSEFLNFYAGCMRHTVKPKIVCIEKKSTGVTLLSVLGGMQGLQLMDLPRLKNKTERFLEVQPYIAAKQITFIRYAKHTQLCIEHCKKITANNTHARDDIADTLADAVKIALIDKTVLMSIKMGAKRQNDIVSRMAKEHQMTQQMIRGAYGQRRI